MPWNCRCELCQFPACSKPALANVLRTRPVRLRCDHWHQHLTNMRTGRQAYGAVTQRIAGFRVRLHSQCGGQRAADLHQDGRLCTGWRHARLHCTSATERYHACMGGSRASMIWNVGRTDSLSQHATGKASVLRSMLRRCIVAAPAGHSLCHAWHEASQKRTRLSRTRSSSSGGAMHDHRGRSTGGSGVPLLVICKAAASTGQQPRLHLKQGLMTQSLSRESAVVRAGHQSCKEFSP